MTLYQWHSKALERVRPGIIVVMAESVAQARATVLAHYRPTEKDHGPEYADHPLQVLSVH